jgi:lipid-binding SYLF domain-containing protein
MEINTMLPQMTSAAGLAVLLAFTMLAPAPAQQPAGAGSTSERQKAAYKRVSDAVGVVHKMANETGMAELLGQALGVYIVPSYGRAALGVGAAGGSGVLVVKRADGRWGYPAFFNTGGVSIGLQAGAEGGPIALLLMSPKAVDRFRKKNNFSVSADAGLTVVDYARVASGTVNGDVIAWSGNKGLFGNAATIAVNDVRFNPRLTDAYYGKPTTAQQALDSPDLNPQADALRQALAAPPTAAGTGAK